jgi:carbamoyltransferase
MSDYIIGLAGLVIDGATCVVGPDGAIAAAVEEERPARLKHASMRSSGGLPYRSIESCLKTAGIGWRDVSDVGYFFQPWREFRRMTTFRLGASGLAPAVAAYYGAYQLEILRGHLAVPRLLKQQDGYRARFSCWNHHLTHAASAFYPTSFDSAAILVMDAFGERDSISFLVGEGTGIRRLRHFDFPSSWGFLYSQFTRHLGFEPNSDEYKVMGLAAFGEPDLLDDVLRLVRLSNIGVPELDRSYFDSAFRGPAYFGPKFYQVFGPPRKRGEPVTDRHRSIAASIQRALEISGLRLAQELRRLTGETRLCIAGGTALNCTMNTRILCESGFADVFVPPAPHDSGCAAGAALLVRHQQLGLPRADAMTTASLGAEYTDAEIRATLEACKLRFEQSADIASDTADLLCRGLIVGWFQGRGEWGPRALGSRSILADPTRSDMKDRVNASVKYREDFRPFAPSVLAEAAGDYFLDVTKSPFMLFVSRVRPERAAEIPAVLHVDNTARLQTVEKSSSPLYYRMIQAFAARRGVPMVLNTSFNVQGEPIVTTPRDAVRCLFGSGLDALVIGRYIVRKAAQAELSTMSHEP